MRLRQILNNLVTNAARATQSGRITIGARREGDWLRLSVSDTGCGIAPEKHEAIFTAFEQVGAQQSGASGIGLGLAIVRQLVEVLGGDIERRQRDRRGRDLHRPPAGVRPAEESTRRRSRQT